MLLLFSVCIFVRICVHFIYFVLVIGIVFGRPFVKQFALRYQTVICLSRLSVLSVALVYVVKRLDGSR